ncbi:hypothetical protein AI27_17925 [Sphingomonas sp. BHC-A]|nr:hypothetical protein AI27_17925 [Sphingomonas sp. BHC-A]
MIRDYPDFPIIERGTNGRSYVIDFDDAWAFIKGLRDNEEREQRARADEVRQYGLSLLGGEAMAQTQVGLSPTEHRTIMENELLATKLAEKRGDLIHKASVEEALGELVAWFQQQGTSLSARLAKRGDFSRDQLAIIDAVIAQDQRELADRMERIGRATGNAVSSDRDPAV